MLNYYSTACYTSYIYQLLFLRGPEHFISSHFQGGAVINTLLKKAFNLPLPVSLSLSFRSHGLLEHELIPLPHQLDSGPHRPRNSHQQSRLDQEAKPSRFPQHLPMRSAIQRHGPKQDSKGSNQVVPAQEDVHALRDRTHLQRRLRPGESDLEDLAGVQRSEILLVEQIRHFDRCNRHGKGDDVRHRGHRKRKRVDAAQGPQCCAAGLDLATRREKDVHDRGQGADVRRPGVPACDELLSCVCVNWGHKHQARWDAVCDDEDERDPVQDGTGDADVCGSWFFGGDGVGELETAVQGDGEGVGHDLRCEAEDGRAGKWSDLSDIFLVFGR